MIANCWSEARRNLSIATQGRGPEVPFPDYREDPNGFLRDIIGFKPWTADDARATGRSGKTGQDEWNDALVRDRRVAIVAANGTGKTHDAAGLALWFMLTRRNAQVITVAPKWDQVVNLLWGKLRTMFFESRTKLPGEPMKSQWELAPSWIARGFSTDEETRAQGIHTHTSLDGEEGDLLVIVDEAAGVAEYIYNALRGWSTRGNVYILLIGNANVAEGSFYRACSSPSWTTFQVSAFDCPAWLITDEWIESMREDPGEGTPQWQIRVEGQFSEKGGEYQFFPAWLLRQCDERAPIATDDEKHIGVDLADTGGDRCVATLTTGGIVQAVEAWNTDELMDSVANITALAESWGVTRDQAHRIHIDKGGLGAGVCSRLRQIGWPIDPVDYGAAPRGEWASVIGDAKFRNRKAELHWAARQLMVQGKLWVPPKFAVTRRQLGWLRWRFVEGSETLQVEPKKDLAKRGIQGSPDYADSFLLSLSRKRAAGKLAWTL